MEFVFPKNFQDLASKISNVYCVEELLSTRQIPLSFQDIKIKYSKNGGTTVLSNFDFFYSVLQLFKEINPILQQQIWEFFIKECTKYCSNLNDLLNSTSENTQIDSETQQQHRNSLKMKFYLLVQFSEHFLNVFNKEKMENSLVTTGRQKRGSKSKKSQGVDWEVQCEHVLHLMIKFLDLRLNLLWESHIIEDEFVNLIANFGYKVLENETLMKTKVIKEMVFHLIGYIIKKFNQSMSVSLKIVQMLQHFEHLVNSLAEGTAMWYNTYKCKSIVTEILREFGHIQEKELLRDSALARATSGYITELGKLLPDAMLANISLVVTRLDEETYMLRNAVLSIMGEIIIHCLSKEGLAQNDKNTRDHFFEHLYDHAYLDPSSYTRCRVVHIYTALVKEQALPVKRYTELTKLCSEMLLDKTNLVRKATVQLLQAILTWNPFGQKLPLPILEKSLEENAGKLAELLKEIGATKPVEKDDEESNKASKEKLKRDEKSVSQEIETTNSDNEEQFETNEKTSQANSEEYEHVSPEIKIEIIKLKDLIVYLKDSISFVEEFQKIVPILCKFLKSRMQSDVIEAIHFFTVTNNFNLDFTFVGVREMLEQIWNDDIKVKECVVSAYKALYFAPECSSAREAANIVADNLMKFANEFTFEQLKSLEQLLYHLDESKELPNGLTQILWERISTPENNNSKSIETIPAIEQQKLAMQMLGLLGSGSEAIIKKNFDELVRIGFQDVIKLKEGEELNMPVDYSLAKYTCECLQTLQVKKQGAGKYAKAFRINSEHQVFERISSLLVKGYTHLSINWEHFAMEAVATIFALCKSPCEVAYSIIENLDDILRKNTDQRRNKIVMSRLLLVLGHTALKELVYWDVHVLSEMKRRRKEEEEIEERKNKKKNKDKKRDSGRKKSRKSLNEKGEENLEDEMGLGGVTADDADQEYINNYTENKIVQKDTLLGRFTPLIARLCMAPVDTKCQQSILVLASAAEALAKYMLVSSKFCENHLQLLFTLLEKAPVAVVRANLVIPISDMCVRFPNLLEPWTSHIYARLKDDDEMVRIYTLKVLRHLILKDMIKVKGLISQVAWCIVDKNVDISSLAKNFFRELAGKGNSVYNFLPDIISRLSDPEIGMPNDSEFRVVMKFLFLLIKKEKQIESLVEKLCHRLGGTRDKRQWSDISYCLSLLPFSEKSFRKMQANFTCFADKLSEKQVYDSFTSILTKLKKGAKEELKVQIEELEGILNECHQKGVTDEMTASKAANVVKKTRKPHMKSPGGPVAWCNDSGTEDSNIKEAPRTRRKKKTRVSSSENSSETEESGDHGERRAPVVARRRLTRSTIKKTVINFSSSESEDEEDYKENVNVEASAQILEESSVAVPLISRRKSLNLRA